MKAQEILDKQTKEVVNLNVRMKEDKDMGKTNPKFKQEIMQNVEKADANMKSEKMTGDEDKDFAMMMKMHHEMAIDMANIYYKSATDNMLKTMTEKGMADQKKEIEEFNQWLASHK